MRSLVIERSKPIVNLAFGQISIDNIGEIRIYKIQDFNTKVLKSDDFGFLEEINITERKHQ